MSENIVDIIHNLTYNVSDASGLDIALKKMKQQADAIDAMKGKLEELNKYYNTAETVQQQTQAKAAIDKTTKAIDIQTQVLVKQFNTNRQVQNALTAEIGIIQRLTDKLNDLRHARERQTDVSQIRAINTEMGLLKKELNDLTSEGGGKGGLLASLFGGNNGSLGRQVLTGALLGFGIGGGMGLITRATSALVEFGQSLLDTAKKEKEVADANESLKKSFDTLAESISTAFKTSEDNANFEAFEYNSLRDALDTSVDAYKRKEEAIKAIGVTQGNVANAERAQLDAANERRTREREEIQKQIDLYTKLHDILSIGKYGLGNQPGLSLEGQIQQFLNTPGIPQDVKDKFRADTNEAAEKGGDVGSIVEAMRRQMGAKAEQLTQEGANKDAEKLNAEKELQSKINNEIYIKNKELNQEIATEQESYRQLKEKEDIASIDRIVADTHAKYQKLYTAIKKDAVDTAKLVVSNFEKKDLPGGGEDYEGEFDLNFKKLPASTQQKYNALLTDNPLAEAQDTNNQKYELALAQYKEQLQNSASQSQGSADAAKFNAGYGLADYNGMAAGLDADTKAKKEALHTQFVNQSSAITDNDAVIEAQRQYDEKLIEIEKEAYRVRLGLASQYYDKLSQQILATSNLIATRIDTKKTNDLTDIVKGKRTFWHSKEDLQEIRTAEATQEQSANTISAANQQIPEVQKAIDKDKEAAVNAPSTDKTQEAVNQVVKDQKKLADLEKEIAEAKKKDADATALIAEKEKQVIIQKIDLVQTLATATVEAYDTISEARQKDLDREISARTQRVDLAEKLAERGNTTALAQEQKALDAATQQRRQAALQEQEINATLTVSNAILAVAKAAVAGEGLFSPVLIASVIAALGVGFAEASALGNAQKTNFAKGVVNFKGKGGPTDDANPVNISTGESVITAAGTAKHSGLLERINKGLPIFAPAPQMKEVAMLHQVDHGSKLDSLIGRMDYMTDVIAGKQVHAEQSITKAGIHQIVTEETRAHSNRWR